MILGIVIYVTMGVHNGENWLRGDVVLLNEVQKKVKLGMVFVSETVQTFIRTSDKGKPSM